MKKKDMMTPNTDIVILIRATEEFPIAELFNKCIDSLVTYTTNYRLIFVDDDSDEDGRQMISKIASEFRSCILVQTNFQRWFTRAANIGLSLVRTPQAVLLNCDCVMGEGWLDELYTVKDLEDQTGKVGLVGSVWSHEEGRQYAVCQYPGYVTGHCVLFDINSLHQVSVYRGTPGRYLDEINPQMIHIRSDVEICYKMMEINLKCIHAFKSAVGHISGQTWGHQLGRIPCSVDVVNERYDGQ